MRNGVDQTLMRNIYMRCLYQNLFKLDFLGECVLNKRQAFEIAYDSFDIEKVCQYDDEKVIELQQNKEIIRNKLKIKASINNSKIFKDIQKEFGSFNNYLKTFTDGKTYYEIDKTTSPISDAISKDLQKRGMKFVGSTIIYSYLQAIGVIISHDKDCFLFAQQRRPFLGRKFSAYIFFIKKRDIYF